MHLTTCTLRKVVKVYLYIYILVYEQRVWEEQSEFIRPWIWDVLSIFFLFFLSLFYSSRVPDNQSIHPHVLCTPEKENKILVFQSMSETFLRLSTSRWSGESYFSLVVPSLDLCFHNLPFPQSSMFGVPRITLEEIMHGSTARGSVRPLGTKKKFGQWRWQQTSSQTSRSKTKPFFSCFQTNYCWE